MTRTQFLQRATQRLAAAGLEDASREARLLLAAALDTDRASLAAQDGKNLSPEEESRLETWLSRREKHEPVARIRGSKEFWRAYFTLNEATLEPRPDTETLIETALEFLPDTQARLRILDLGTGTGCLLLSLLQEYPNSSGLGTDQSARALEAAKENSFRLKLADRAQFVQANWADGLMEAFQLIVSNPPYIPARIISTLESNVRDYDPRLALDGGEDGLAAYRALAKLVPKHLAHQGRCLLEIGQGQEESVTDLFEAAGLKLQAYRRDLNGIIRALVFQSA